MTLRHLTLLGGSLAAWSRLARSQGGQALAMVVVLTGVGTMIIVPMLVLLQASFDSIGRALEDTESFYAADAAVGAVLSDLRQGEDALDGGYTLPTVDLNSFTPSLSVSAPPEPLELTAVYVDPHTTTSLDPLSAATQFLYEVHQVRPSTDIDISWVFAPAASDWKLQVYEGSGTGGTQLLNVAGSTSPATSTVPGGSVTGGTYTVRFFNDSAGPLASASTTGEEGSVLSTIGSTPGFSLSKRVTPVSTCFRSPLLLVSRVVVVTPVTAGRANAASTAMMATTTVISTRVKPPLDCRVRFRNCIAKLTSSVPAPRLISGGTLCVPASLSKEQPCCNPHCHDTEGLGLTPPYPWPRYAPSSRWVINGLILPGYHLRALLRGV